MGDTTVCKKIMVMKTFVLLAAIALAVSAVPEDQHADDVVPETALLMTTAEASYDDAKKQVSNMLQSGQSSNACGELADALLDEVTSAVKIGQKALEDMDRGEHCSTSGDSFIEAAVSAQSTADAALASAESALADAKGADVDMGEYAYASLDSGQCGSLFTITAYTSAKAKAESAQTDRDQKQGAADAAKAAVEQAKSDATTLVRKCVCNVKNALAKAVLDMNKAAAVQNTMSWNKAKHMQCVLAGTAVADCDTGTVPTISAVGVHESVTDITCEGWILALTASSGAYYDSGCYAGSGSAGCDRTDAFSNVKSNQIKMTDESGNKVEWTHGKDSSLATLFKGGEISSNVAVSKWRALVPSAGYQNHCNAQGLNRQVASHSYAVRFGVIMNQENDCNSPDSVIGLGHNKNKQGVGAYCGCCQNGGTCNTRNRTFKVHVWEKLELAYTDAEKEAMAKAEAKRNGGGEEKKVVEPIVPACQCEEIEKLPEFMQVEVEAGTTWMTTYKIQTANSDDNPAIPHPGGVVEMAYRAGPKGAGHLNIFTTTFGDSSKYKAHKLNEMSELTPLGDVTTMWEILPNKDHTDAEIKIMSDHMAGGGRLIMVGEHSGYAADSNTIITNTLKKLGGGIEVLNGIMSENTHSPQNINKLQVMGGVMAFETAAWAPIKVDKDVSEILISSNSGQIFSADQQIGKGRVTVWADVNPIGSYSTKANNQVFFRNLVHQSSNFVEAVSKGGNPNEGGPCQC